MFFIVGHAEFTEADMSIGEKLKETLTNEGFYVEKNYVLRNPSVLVLDFKVETTEDRKPDSLFSIE